MKLGLVIPFTKLRNMHVLIFEFLKIAYFIGAQSGTFGKKGAFTLSQLSRVLVNIFWKTQNQNISTNTGNQVI